MPIDADKLPDLLQQLPPAPAGYVVAYSGGLDSTVLLHAMAQLREADGLTVFAVHVNHQLHPDALRWSEHCRAFATELGVPCRLETVTVVDTGNQGPEAAARAARYEALQAYMRFGQVLLTAHHLEDQFETVLLRLLRGGGVAGLGAMAPRASFPPGEMCRPLLDVSRAELQRYAQHFDLHWVDDSSNEDLRFDRNFLRHRITAEIIARWPGAASNAARSAAIARDARALLDELAEDDLSGIAAGETLSVTALKALTLPRVRNCLRRAIEQRNLPMPSARKLETIWSDLINARGDAQPHVQWPGAEVRRYRDRVYLRVPIETPLPEPRTWQDPRHQALSGDHGRLRLRACTGPGLAPALADSSLEVCFRRGGERLRPVGSRHHRRLKFLFQDHGIVPWMRDWVPLIYAGEKLAAVGDLWISADLVETPGLAVDWDAHPPLT